MNKHVLRPGLALLVSLFLGSCSLLPLSSGSQTPTPEVASPGPSRASIHGRVWQDRCGLADGTLGPNCAPLSDGRYRADGVIQSNEPGLGGVTVALGPSCPAAPIIRAVTAADGSFAFEGLPAGLYCLTVDPGLQGNEMIIAGHWTSPQVDEAGAPASLLVSVVDGEIKTGIGFGRDATWGMIQPTATPTPTLALPTVTPPPARTPAPACTDRLTFIGDVTIPDRTNVLPGTAFVKTWRLRNDGTCTWNADYALIFYGGDGMQGRSPASLPGIVVPGQTVDVSITLVAPAGNGTYRGEWILRNGAGRLLGLGPSGVSPFWVQIVVGSTATPTPTATAAIVNWRGEYFSSRNLSGAPLFVRDDVSLDFNWGAGAPGAGLPVDDFSARWTRTLQFNAGRYRFTALADDGVRMWIDGQPVLDDWHDGGAGLVSGEIALAQGAHVLRVEYYEAAGLAALQLKWEPVTATATPTSTVTPTATSSITPTATATTTPTPTATAQTAPVIQSFTVAPTSVRSGQPVTLSWAVTGAQQVTLWRLDSRGRLAEPNGIPVSATGTMVMDPNDPLNLTYSFYLHATAGNQFASATVSASVCEGESCAE